MLAFNCPTCKANISLPDSARGERVICGHCGESVFVAGSSGPTASASQPARVRTAGPIIAERPYSVRRRRKSGIWTLIPYLVISGVTGYFAWEMYNATVNRPAVQPGRAVAAAPKRDAPLKVEARRRRDIPKLPSPPQPPKIEPPKIAKVSLPSLAQIPEAVTLPSLADDQVTTLAAVKGDIRIQLFSNSKGLTLKDEKLLWKDELIAGIRCVDGQIQFRWMKDVSNEAETAVRNSLLSVRAGSEERHVRLREPMTGDPLLLDLKKATHRVNAECDYLPPIEQIRFELTLKGQVPVKEVNGPDIKSLGVHEETLVVYDFTGDAATKVTVKKSGSAVAVLLATQYVLPSGDVEAMSISRGTRKLNELRQLQADAADAVTALPRLRSYRVGLDGDLQQAQSISTMGRVPGVGLVQNPVAVGQKEMAIRAVQNEIVATERNIARAAQLADDKPSIDLDVRAMQHVETLARSLHEAPLPYRFYITIDGHDVDLVSWSPTGDPIDKKPILHAQPVR